VSAIVAALSEALRRALRPARRRAHQVKLYVRPLRPPSGAPNPELSAAPADDWFITGNGIARCCRYVLNYGELSVNEGVDNSWWFCKSDFLEYFFRELAPKEPFVLFTHNSDRTIGEGFLRELRRPRLIAWFAQNPGVEHPKLRALPIGIANPRWRHGDQAVLRRVQLAERPKRELFDVSFVVESNEAERRYCLEQTGLRLAERVGHEAYLERLASARFCLSPRGNGIDTHRTWEALYLRTVPIVTRNLVTDHHPDLPMIVLDDWSQFRSLDFSPELYEQTIGDWSPSMLRLDSYLDRVERTIRELVSSAV
jgi:hypothetical protein